MDIQQARKALVFAMESSAESRHLWMQGKMCLDSYREVKKAFARVNRNFHRIIVKQPT